MVIGTVEFAPVRFVADFTITGGLTGGSSEVAAYHADGPDGAPKTRAFDWTPCPVAIAAGNYWIAFRIVEDA